MQIILLEKIRNLGDLGDQVTVKPGFGRNFLIPKGKAVRATPENKARFESERAERERRQQEQLANARARAERLGGLTIQLVRKAGEEGRIFGSVGTSDIAEAMVAAGFEITKAEIELPNGPLKTVGDHELQVSLHSEVTATIIVSVVAES
ncbi:50S ribosomal protein L9 [Acidiferrobacter sp. SPIII_3]|jgi:large subunit ribosomal protein L9|uniref:50S ribosomal protein L9 n=1 Tax=Acidiferrobacter sp. SPIII_3 TaxID=1281578 RepID=UPI000D734CE2|nr:50S ribosomal protein L9 [Acidiferrobacter sp. SPIII_3]AWP23399.1 50S ribosomal protein L9 [Acidiferrobacter sp. SPIII_3]